MEMAQRAMVEDKREQQAAARGRDNLTAQKPNNVVLQMWLKINLKATPNTGKHIQVHIKLEVLTFKNSWGGLVSHKKVPLHQFSYTVVCLCGLSCWKRPLGALILALFVLVKAFKATRHSHCQQLYLRLYGDGVLLTGNFPGSLPDQVAVIVHSTLLPCSICVHSTHGSTKMQKRDKQSRGLWSSYVSHRKREVRNEYAEWGTERQGKVKQQGRWRRRMTKGDVS